MPSTVWVIAANESHFDHYVVARVGWADLQHTARSPIQDVDGNRYVYLRQSRQIEGRRPTHDDEWELVVLVSPSPNQLALIDLLYGAMHVGDMRREQQWGERRERRVPIDGPIDMPINTQPDPQLDSPIIIPPRNVPPLAIPPVVYDPMTGEPVRRNRDEAQLASRFNAALADRPNPVQVKDGNLPEEPNKNKRKPRTKRKKSLDRMDMILQEVGEED